MPEVSYAQLQRRYGGQYIVRRDGDVLASAETYDALGDLVEALPEPGGDLVIEYVEPMGSVRVYGMSFARQVPPTGITPDSQQHFVFAKL